MNKSSYLHNAALYAVIGVSVLVLGLSFGADFFAQANVPGFSIPVDSNDTRFGCNPNGSWADTVWCNNYGSTFESHVTEAGKHQGVPVMFKRTLTGYGEYYVAGSYGSSDAASGLAAGSIVHCPSGATIQFHLRSHMKYSPNLGEGYYDGDSHYWCDQNGVAVNPVIGPADGMAIPDVGGTALYKFTFPDGSAAGKDYYKAHKYNATISGVSQDSDWVQCSNGMVGPFLEGGNQHTVSIYAGTTEQNRAKTPHYHCVGSSGYDFVDPVLGTAPPAPFDNAWNFKSAIMYTENLATASEKDVVGTRGPCPRDTYYCQSTSADYRTCSSTPDCTGKFSPPAPAYVVLPPQNPKLDHVNNIKFNKLNEGMTAQTGFSTAHTCYATATFSATGTFPFGTNVSTTTKVSTSKTDFSSPIYSHTVTGTVNSMGEYTGGFCKDANLPIGGPYYFCMENTYEGITTDCVVSGDSFTVYKPADPPCTLGKTCPTNSGCLDSTNCGNTDGSITCYPTGTTCPVNVICGDSKCENGENSLGCAADCSVTSSSCTLGLTLNDGKTTYSKGDMVNYTYACSPSGTKANVTVQLVKPDGTATTYNTGTNIDTSTMGFSTSNLTSGTYVLKACLDAACVSGVASATFTIKTSSTPPTTDVCGNKTCDTGETVATCPADCTTAPTPKSCTIGETCPKGSWCNSGRQCYYPDTSLTCASWQSNTCPSGTTQCSPEDKKTGCIEPGGYGPVSSGYCLNAMECFTSDGTQKYCEPYANDPMNMTTCDSSKGLRYCAPSDTSCIEPGAYGPDSGWCKNSMECFVDGKKFCQPHTENTTMGGMGGMTKCPAGSQICSPTDANCIEPGKTGPVEGWCKNAMECYSTDGKQKFCQGWGDSAAGGPVPAAMSAVYCPAAYPNSCKPGDKNCIEVGKTGPVDGWCGGPAKQCFTDNGLYCAKWDETCPAGTSACRANDTNCVEPGQYGSNNGWCGGQDVVPCYKNDGTGMYCSSFTNTGPAAWETAICPTGTGRCRPEDAYCIEIGETGPSNSWCASGMSKWNDDGTVTCVSSSEYMPGTTTKKTEVKKEDTETCLQVLTPAYNPATNECKNFTTPCKVPTDWKQLNSDQNCKDGKVINIFEESSTDVIYATLEQDQQHLKDLGYQLKKVPSSAPGVQKIGTLIEEGLKKVKELLQSAKKATNTKAFKASLQDYVQLFHKNIIEDVDARMTAIQPYIELSLIQINYETDSVLYERELDLADPKSDFYIQLKTSLDKLKGLFKSIEGQRGDGLSRILDLIKQTQVDLKSLISGKHTAQKDTFVEDTLSELSDHARRLEDSTVSSYQVERFLTLVSSLEDRYEDNRVDDRFLRDMDHAMKILGKIDGFTQPKETRMEDILRGRFDEEFVQNMVEKVIDKLTNKIAVMMDTAMQEIAVKIMEIASVATDKMTQSLSNLTAVADKHREAIAESKNAILAQVKRGEDLMKEMKVQTDVSDKLNQIMELSATINWCGSKADEIQSRVNSALLALEGGELEFSDADLLFAEAQRLSEENNEACYITGASNFRDTPMHLWYFAPTQYNSEAGFITGYRDESGSLKGEFGPSDPALRIEALAMAMRIFDVPVGNGDNAPGGFTGVPEWGRGYINGATGNGIALDERWDWAQPVSRSESAEIFSAVGYEHIRLPETIKYASKYTDYSEFSGDITATYAVDALTELEVFQGFEGRFNPGSPLLRSEFATVNQRLVENLGLEVK